MVNISTSNEFYETCVNQLALCQVSRLGTFAPETASESEILGLNGDPLGVDGSQIGVLKERYQISFAGLL